MTCSSCIAIINAHRYRRSAHHLSAIKVKFFLYKKIIIKIKEEKRVRLLKDAMRLSEIHNFHV